MGLRGFRFFNMKNIETQARTFLKLNALSNIYSSEYLLRLLQSCLVFNL